MSGDAYYESVKLLLHCDGTDNSTTFTDSSLSGRTVTAAGNAHVETDQYKFGTASAYFDGTGDYLSTTGVTFGSGDFTVEAWIRIATPASGFVILETRNADITNTGFLFYVRGTTHLSFGTGSPSFTITEGSTAVSADTWHHVALTKRSNTIRGYLDGTKEFEVADTRTFSNTSWRIGHSWNASGTNSDGYVDDSRVTVGTARYTGSTLSVPTAAFPNIAGQIAGSVLDDAGAPVARVVRAYRRDTGVLVGSTTSSAGDGSYSIDSTTVAECSVLCLDDAGGDSFNDLVMRVSPA